MELRMYSRTIDTDAALSPVGEIEPQMRQTRSQPHPIWGRRLIGSFSWGKEIAARSRIYRLGFACLLPTTMATLEALEFWLHAAYTERASSRSRRVNGVR